MPPIRPRAILPLFLNHADAWIVALISGTLALFVHDAFAADTIYLLIAITIGYWAAFALNDYYDAPFDALDEAKGRRSFFVRHTIAGWQIWACVLMLFAVVLPAFLQFGQRGAILLLICLFIAWAYSGPPLRLKRLPIIDLITHATFVETFPYLIILRLIDQPWLPMDGPLLLCAALASLAAQLENQIADYEIDRQTEQNFTTVFGRTTAIWLLRSATIGLIATYIFFTVSGALPLWFAPFAIIALPVLIHRLWHNPPRPRPPVLTAVTVALGLFYLAYLLLTCSNIVLIQQLYNFSCS